MFIVNNYSLAVVLCVITMLCWGSWGNTQKLAAKSWRYELFYWDYVIGVLLFSLLAGFTLGSFGESGRPFVTDLLQASSSNIFSAIVGGIIFNASNILLSASISLAGLAVAFPLGVGLALVLGVFINYFSAPKGDPVLLFIGVGLIVVAIILNSMAASRKKDVSEEAGKSNKKGIILAVVAGVLMSLFYRFVAAAMDLDNFESPAEGMLTPYSAFFIFSIGIFISNFFFNTYIMKKPFVGKPVSYKEYFKGGSRLHLVGMLGGIIWSLGTLLSYIAAGKAGAAISYALGQGAPMIAAIWGVFIWKEFKGSGKTVNQLLTAMFIFFIVGLSLIVVAGNSDEKAVMNDENLAISVIFETDMGNDVDDALALDMLYKAIEDKKINLLAISTNNFSKYSTKYIDIMNTWYGYPQIPIGKIVNGLDSVHEAVNFAEKVCLINNDEGEPYFKRSISKYEDLPEATKLYRQILAQQPDSSVNIISVGFSTNISRLLASEADEFSSLDGRSLIAQKVKLLSIMGCSFGDDKIAEFNIRTDIVAAKNIFENWPTAVVVTPFEAGMTVEYPAKSIENDFSWVDGKHPLIEAYHSYLPMPYDRPTWDLIAVLYGIDPTDKYFTVSTPGKVTIDDNGFSSFAEEKNGNHMYLTINPQQAAATLDYFVNVIKRRPALVQIHN